jgi:hypothetical protein
MTLLCSDCTLPTEMDKNSCQKLLQKLKTHNPVQRCPRRVHRSLCDYRQSPAPARVLPPQTIDELARRLAKVPLSMCEDWKHWL